MDNFPSPVLLHIFQYLEFPEHIKLYDLNTRFASLIEMIWRRIFKSLSINFELQRISEKDLHCLLKSISSCVEYIKLINMEPKHFDVLIAYSYPQAKFLHYTFKMEAEHSRIDRDMEIMATAFSKVKGLRPYGKISGAFLAHMKSLTHLNLSQCNEVDSGCLSTAINSLKLNWLRLQCNLIAFPYNPENNIKNFGRIHSLFLNASELILFMYDRRADMSSLRELAVSYSGTTFRMYTFRCRLLKKRFNEITEIQTICFSYIWSGLHALYDVQPLKLRKITIVGEINAYFINSELDRFVALRELAFINCSFAQNNVVHKLLIDAINVEFIRIEYCLMALSLFRIEVDTIALRRRTKLTLNFFKNKSSVHANVLPVLLGRNALFELTQNESAPVNMNFQLLIKFDEGHKENDN